MNQPIFELKIVDEILFTMRKANIGFYQRELSYDHCEVSNILEELSYPEKSDEEKRTNMIESLRFCDGNYLMPLLKKLRQEGVTYYNYAIQILLHEFYTVDESVIVNPMGSVFEQLRAWLETFLKMYQEKEGQSLNESQLSVVFDFKLRALLNECQNSRQKELK